MFCYKCKSKIDLIENKVGFRATCDICGADLHVCKNCKHYMIGKPNDCHVPNTEYVVDKEKNNFCEDFAPKDSLPNDPKIKKEDIAKKLFGNDPDEDPPSSFNFLFKR